MNTHRDFRGLDEATQAELRRLAFRDLDEGDSIYRVAERMGVHYQTVRDWRKRRREIEKRDCYGETRGREKETQKVLSASQQKRILAAIKDSTPDTHGIAASLWDRRALQELIRKKSRQTVVLQTVSKYCARWGLTPQRPAKYAREQDHKKITKWLKQQYPRIKRRAKAEGAVIEWEDETGVKLSTFYARSYAPEGQTPHLALSAKQAHISMISAISNRGDCRFMLYEKGFNSAVFTCFLNRLIKNATRKIFLIVDNLIVHKSKRVKAWQIEHHDQLEIFFPATLRTAVQS